MPLQVEDKNGCQYPEQADVSHGMGPIFLKGSQFPEPPSCFLFVSRPPESTGLSIAESGLYWRSTPVFSESLTWPDTILRSEARMPLDRSRTRTRETNRPARHPPRR